MAAKRYVSIEKLWNMRAKGAYPGDMTAKREKYTMDAIEKSMRSGKIEPIETTRDSYFKDQQLQDGKHRLIIAKKLGLKRYPITFREGRR